MGHGLYRAPFEFYSPKPDSIISIASLNISFSSGPSHSTAISVPYLMQDAIMFIMLLPLIFLLLTMMLMFEVYFRSVYKELHADRETGC